LSRTDDSRTGDISESIVETGAWLRGAEVFPNKGCTGATDIILKIKGILVEIDVKTETRKSWKGRNWWGIPKSTKVEGVYMVVVNPVTHRIRWRKSGRGRSQTIDCPLGLEDFWD
tara:strand:+ start:311 stop:655 length:345 start_codon:yes stop_codon:yes gene_type:complete